MKKKKREAISRFCFLFLIIVCCALLKRNPFHRFTTRFPRHSFVSPLSILTFFLLFPVLTELSYIASAFASTFASTSASAFPGALQQCERTNGPVAASIPYSKLQKKRELTGYETWEEAFVHRGEEREKGR